jgi:hypothetical protein
MSVKYDGVPGRGEMLGVPPYGDCTGFSSVVSSGEVGLVISEGGLARRFRRIQTNANMAATTATPEVSSGNDRERRVIENSQYCIP